MKAVSSWQWSAFGKHPVAADFFWLGHQAPLLKGFSEWVEKGYQGVLSKNPSPQRLHAWRFWARGAQKGHVACGVVRDSSDRIGRPFPLLIVGTGMLEGWEEHWHLMPFACERTWDQIDYLAAFVINDLKKLDQEVRQLRPPLSDWRDFERNRKDSKTLEEEAFSLLGGSEGFCNLKMNPNVDLLNETIHCLDRMRNRTKAAPHAVFLGGTADRTCLALFRHPLQTSDFIQLWSLQANESVYGT
ncbi:MAG: type VI secretion system-associated protein TagF [Desulfobacterota bacterium]|nr:type VI secretion system-associated protein TagF [Thermodesulfobacteriota bacterium]